MPIMGTWYWVSDMPNPPSVSFSTENNVERETTPPQGYTDDGSSRIGYPTFPDPDPWDEFRYECHQINLFKMAMRMDSRVERERKLLEVRVKDQIRAEERQRTTAEARRKMQKRHAQRRRRTKVVKRWIASSQSQPGSEVNPVDLTSDIDNTPTPQNDAAEGSFSLPHSLRSPMLGSRATLPSPRAGNRKLATRSSSGTSTSPRRLHSIKIPPSTINRDEYQYIEVPEPPVTPVRQVSRDEFGTAMSTPASVRSYATSAPTPSSISTTPYTPTVGDPAEASDIDGSVAPRKNALNLTRVSLSARSPDESTYTKRINIHSTNCTHFLDYYK
ncbi:hypothetical protein BU16DRAFT_64284 [Lophium mytilinum]|uniref:Uncharacterized protein n=1 Tax=Lophium mytilinum TaxID=390894 RepID=A0A6A6QPZ5_9PEZI|nr:hypothetical protein BU16DRAFT_64284 [Lophium mytilinum]